MRILFLTENFPPEVNAVATRVYERALYWARAGHDVTVLTCFPNFPQGRLYPGWKQRVWQRSIVDGISVVRVPTYITRNDGVFRRTLDFVSFMVSAVVAAPALQRPDVVVATSPQFFAAVAGWIVSVVKWRPFVFEVSDLWPASIRAVGAVKVGRLLDLMERVELFLYRRASAVVALTAAFKDDLVRRGISPEKIAVVINGVDLPRYSPRAKDPDLMRELGLVGNLVVGYVGTHGPAHDLLNVAAAAAFEELADVRFLFVGDGAAKPALVAHCREHGLEAFEFVDPQPKQRVPAYWSVCDVALIHLKNDAVFADVIPSKMFEAMAMGLPLLLVAPEGEASRIVERERAGLIVPAGNPGALAEAVRRLRDDPELRRGLAANSLAAAPRYSRKRQADHLLEVLSRVLRRERVEAA